MENYYRVMDADKIKEKIRLKRTENMYDSLPDLGTFEINAGRLCGGDYIIVSKDHRSIQSTTKDYFGIKMEGEINYKQLRETGALVEVSKLFFQNEMKAGENYITVQKELKDQIMFVQQIEEYLDELETKGRNEGLGTELDTKINSERLKLSKEQKTLSNLNDQFQENQKKYEYFEIQGNKLLQGQKKTL